MSETLIAALEYAKRGWYVFPVHSIIDGKCSCGKDCASPGKHPRLADGLLGASKDEKLIEYWFSQLWPVSNVAVVTGEKSGIVAIDIDSGSLPVDPGRTIEQATGSGGRHLLFKHPGVYVKSRTGVFPGVDSRGDGGYIIVPPSNHISGNYYRWVNDPAYTELAECPDWWVEAVGKKQEPRRSDGVVHEGGRNNYLTSLAGSLRRRGMSAKAIEAAILAENEAACNPPLPDDEVIRIANSIGWRPVVSEDEEFSIQIGEEAAKNFVVSNQEIIKKKLITQEAQIIPNKGLIKEIVDYILETSIYPQPLLAVGAAVAFLGALCGQKYQSETGLRTNVYIVGLADSGDGKDHARKKINQLSMLSSTDIFFGGDDLASGRGLLSSLQIHPSRVFLLDEFGLLMQAITKPNAPSHQRDIMTTLMKLYSSAGNIYRGTEYADQKENKRHDIIDPCACVYGTSTHESFYNGLTTNEAGSGALSRMIIFSAGTKRPDRKMPKLIPPSDTLIKKIKILAEYKPEGSGNLGFETMVVPMTPEVFADWERLIDEMSSLAADASLKSLYARVHENAVKLALIHAVSINPADPVIDLESWLWGRNLTVAAIQTLIDQFDQYASDNDVERKSKRLEGIIRRSGESGITKAELCRRGRWLTKFEREELLNDLVESGIIRFEMVASSKKTAYVYIHNTL